MVMKAIYLDELTSTNTYLSLAVKNGTKKQECYVVVDFQKEGKGQGDNSWHSNRKENLLTSVLLFPEFLSASEQFGMAIVASLAVCEVLEKYLKAMIKWPNDILVGNRKIAGILIENGIMENRVTHSIIGLGLNLNQDRFPPFPRKATSLFFETGVKCDPREMADAFVVALEGMEKRLEKGERALLEEEYLEKFYLQGQASDFESAEGIFRGTITGITPEGELRIRGEDGMKSYGFSEVRFLE